MSNLFASVLKLTFTTLLLSFSSILFSKSNIDSLRQALPLKRDTVLFEKYIYISRASYEPDTSIRYSELALQLATELKSQRLIAEAHYRLGQYYDEKGWTKRSIEKLDTAIAICKKIHYPKRLSYAYTHKGYVLNDEGKVKEALASFYSGLEVTRKEGLKRREGHILVDIGDLFRKQRNFKEALDHFKQAKEVFKSIDNQFGICRAEFHVGSSYMAMEGKEKDCINIYDDFLKGPCGEDIRPSYKASVFNNMGGAYRKLSDFKNAEKYLLKALEIKKAHSSLSSVAHTQNEISTLYENTEQYDKALDIALKAFDNVKKDQDIYLETTILKNISDIYGYLGDNKKRINYQDRHNILRDSIENIEQAKSLAEIQAKFQNAEQEREIAATKLEVLRQENRFNNLLLTAICILLAGGFFFFWYWNRVKTKEREAQQLLELDKMKSQYFTNISHELRTPLSLIIDPLEKLNKAVDEDQQKEWVSLAHQQSKRMLQMVNQMLDLAKLESKKMNLVLQQGDLHFFLKRIFYSFESLAAQKQIDFQYSNNTEIILAHFDPQKLEKIIYNLIGNAIKFTPIGGTIHMMLLEMGDEVEIVLKDSGVGIPNEKLPYVFDRFYQVDRSDTRTYGGTGIGLALAKELVELHQGEINIESHLNKGTQVKVKLPKFNKQYTEKIKPLVLGKEKKEPVLMATNLKDQTQSKDQPTAKEKNIVLIVEDQPDLRAYIKQQLQDKYQVLEAIDGNDGWEIGTQQIPDIIISDIMMPGIDGIRLCKKFKKDQRTSHIPVILLTAKSEQEDKYKGLHAGANDYISKPFDSVELVLKIDNLIRERELLIEKSGKKISVSPKEVKVSSMDQNFIQNLLDIIEENMSDDSFGVEELSKIAGMSRSQLHRKIKALTGNSTNLFLRSIRLKRAMQLLKQGAASASEIAYEVGFSNPNYFYKCFKEEFGVPPGQILKESKKLP